jgi:hypothetical protein
MLGVRTHLPSQKIKEYPRLRSAAAKKKPLRIAQGAGPKYAVDHAAVTSF